MRKVDTIIFNPTWTPPDEPWSKAKSNPVIKVEAGSNLNPLGPIKNSDRAASLIHGGKGRSSSGQFRLARLSSG
jgi:hypothetical protein